MAELILDSIDVRGYRAFRELRVERFGRVNLLVGRNNSGKTSLLEAIRLYKQGGTPAVFWDVLQAREELLPAVDSDPDLSDPERVAVAYEQLFHGRESSRGSVRTFSIGPGRALEQDVLRVQLAWIADVALGSRQAAFEFDQPSAPAGTPARPVLSVEFRSTTLEYALEAQLLRSLRTSRSDAPGATRMAHVPPNGVTRRTLGRLWDNVALTSAEDDVVEALRLVAPSVDRITLVGDRTAGRIPVVRVEGYPRPVPLGSMGDGMNRVLGVVLSLANARDGVLVVDEFENGVHYTVLPDLWRLVFRTAQRLNVQVFASTHSWDCIQAFQLAAADDSNEEAVLVRLEASARGVRSTVFGEDDLAVVTRQHVEVR